MTNREKIAKAFWLGKEEDTERELRDSGVEVRNPDGSFKTIFEVMENLSERWDSDKSTATQRFGLTPS